MHKYNNILLKDSKTYPWIVEDKEGQAEVMISCCNLYKSYFFPAAAIRKNFKELGI